MSEPATAHQFISERRQRAGGRTPTGALCVRCRIFRVPGAHWLPPCEEIE